MRTRTSNALLAEVANRRILPDSHLERDVHSHRWLKTASVNSEYRSPEILLTTARRSTLRRFARPIFSARPMDCTTRKSRMPD
jgi:hypothetical protein